jgi:hypothetical protein
MIINLQRQHSSSEPSKQSVKSSSDDSSKDGSSSEPLKRSSKGSSKDSSKDSSSSEKHSEAKVTQDKPEVPKQEDKGSSKKKFKLGCKPCKNALVKGEEKRNACETKIYDHLPRPIQPLLSCICIDIKWFLISFATPIIIPLVCILGVVTCIIRILFCCPCGQNTLYSCMEFCAKLEDCLDLYWDVDYWRDHQPYDPNRERALSPKLRRRFKAQGIDPKSPEGKAIIAEMQKNGGD